MSTQDRKPRYADTSHIVDLQGKVDNEGQSPFKDLAKTRISERGVGIRPAFPHEVAPAPAPTRSILRSLKNGTAKDA